MSFLSSIYKQVLLHSSQNSSEYSFLLREFRKNLHTQNRLINFSYGALLKERNEIIEQFNLLYENKLKENENYKVFRQGWKLSSEVINLQMKLTNIKVQLKELQLQQKQIKNIIKKEQRRGCKKN